MDGLKRADRLVQGLRKSITELQIRSNDLGHGNGVIRLEVWLRPNKLRWYHGFSRPLQDVESPFFLREIKTQFELNDLEETIYRLKQDN